MTWHDNFLQIPWYDPFQFKILCFWLVSVSAKSFGQFPVSVSVSEPKPKRWFRSYTTSHCSSGNFSQTDFVHDLFQYPVDLEKQKPYIQPSQNEKLVRLGLIVPIFLTKCLTFNLINRPLPLSFACLVCLVWNNFLNCELCIV